MRNSFSNVSGNLFSRNFGGTTIGVADPYITGYHFIHFDSFPDIISYIPKRCNLSASEVTQVLSATCTGVTPPGGTLNKIEFTGLGGTKWAVPGNIDYGNTVSLKFVEMESLPIASIMHGWVKLMRDYRHGAAHIAHGVDDSTKKRYSALLYYWTTAPDGITVQYYACYDGVFPAKDPQDLFASDVETIGKLDVEIEFNVDYTWHEEWVRDKCQAFSDGNAARRNNIESRNYKGN